MPVADYKKGDASLKKRIFFCALVILHNMILEK